MTITQSHLSTLIGIQNQIYAWHLGTSSLAEHEAFGALFDSVHKLVDDLFETGMGRNRSRINMSFSTTVAAYVDFKTCIDRLEEFVTFIETDLWQWVDGNRDAENTLADLVGAVNKVKFLASLS